MLILYILIFFLGFFGSVEVFRGAILVLLLMIAFVLHKMFTRGKSR